MQRNGTRAILGAAGLLLAALALTPAWATEPLPQQKSNGSNQPAHTTTLRAAAKQQTDLTKDRVRGVQLRAMQERAESEDVATGAAAEPRLSPAGEDATR